MTETDYGAIKNREQLRSCRRILKIQADTKDKTLSGLFAEVRSYYTPGKLMTMAVGRAASSFSGAAILLSVVRAIRKKL